MKLMVDIDIKPPENRIRYSDKLLIVGSCFTEHIGNNLQQLKFSVLQNPNGILFDPLSVTSGLLSYIQPKFYSEGDLLHFDELWHSWQHHSKFSGIDKENVIFTINASQKQAHEFLKESKWLIITLGSAYSYQYLASGKFVANCHKAPIQQFAKHLCTIEEINSALDNCLYQLFKFNPGLNVILTVSPVRHIRDGVINNNRSKARLIEAVHLLVNKFDRIHYFPSYELVIDVLRDYRFYDIDLVHPNYQATKFVLEKFMESFVDKESRDIALEVEKIVTAKKHKPFQATSDAHGRFRQLYLEKTRELSNRYPFLSLQDELEFFGQER